MGYSKKIVILSDVSNIKSERKCYLTLESIGSELFGSVKFFNFIQEKDLTLGIMVDGVMLSTILLRKETNIFTLNIELEVNKDVFALLAYVENGKAEPCFFGGGGTHQPPYKKLTSKALEFNGIGVRPKIDSALFEYTEKEIEETVDKEMQNVGVAVLSDPQPFFNLVEEEIEEMFLTYPKETMLENSIPNSRFCRVSYGRENMFYALGIIYEDLVPEYICYAVPAKSEGEKPKEFAKFCQWLPTKVGGFFMMFQDAKSGKSIVF
ncbi:MAG: hypothetical protein FWD89_00490 [Firmicutes bacterium]|nr:hypothetical protein [Bacillota bacterium]